MSLIRQRQGRSRLGLIGRQAEVCHIGSHQFLLLLLQEGPLRAPQPQNNVSEMDKPSLPNSGALLSDAMILAFVWPRPPSSQTPMGLDTYNLLLNRGFPFFSTCQIGPKGQHVMSRGS